MAKIIKKKVSFDIGQDMLSSINAYCDENQMKRSDFYREAATEYFQKVSTSRELLYFDDYTNRMIKFSVNPKLYGFDKYEAEDEIKEAIGIKSIVVVTDKGLSKDDTLLNKYLLKNNGVLKCFEKQKIE